MQTPIIPYGGRLVDLCVDAARAKALRAAAVEFRSWDLRPRQQVDLELLLNGALSPLDGFMTRDTYRHVLQDRRLGPRGPLWPIPLTLDVDEAAGAALQVGDRLALRDAEGVMLAVLTVAEVWRPDYRAEAQALYGTDDPRHPGVDQLLNQRLPVCVGGRVEGVEIPAHHSFKALYLTPQELRRKFEKFGWGRVAAFHAERPIHRAQHHMSLQAAADLGANLLIQPVVGVEDDDYYHRVRCYNAAVRYFPAQTSMLALLPMAARWSGLRDVLWQAIVRQNYGCTHLLVTPDQGRAPAAAPVDPDHLREDLGAVGADLALECVVVEPSVYSDSRACFVPAREAAPADHRGTLTDEEVRRRLQDDCAPPDWFTFPEVLAELHKVYKPRRRQGFTLFFTGLSGAGKSTIARAVVAKLLEIGDRPVTLLDGDVVRKHLSSELGFSREHRNINVRRIGFVAGQITKNGGIAVCAPIAPYAHVRGEVREMVSCHGGFIEIHVSTPLEVCEARDRKGLYAKARAGLVKEFTGISDPYEAPEHPELSIDTSGLTVEEAAQNIFIFLEKEHYIG